MLESPSALDQACLRSLELVIASGDRKGLEALLALGSDKHAGSGGLVCGVLHAAAHTPVQRAPGAWWSVEASGSLGLPSTLLRLGVSSTRGTRSTPLPQCRGFPKQGALGTSHIWVKRGIRTGPGAVLIFGGSEQVSPETVHYLQSILNNLERTLLERLTFLRECCTRLKINKARSYSLITNKEEDVVHPPPRDAVGAAAPSLAVGSGLLMTEVSHARGSWALAPPWVVMAAGPEPLDPTASRR